MADDAPAPDVRPQAPHAPSGPEPRSTALTVAHDYFTQRGGAERVAAAMVAELRPDRVITAAIEPRRTFPLPSAHPVETSFVQRFPWLRIDPRRAFALLPMAWRLMDPVAEGVVLCSSSGWSHALPIGGRAVKIVYCHNPARWLYQTDDYLKGRGSLLRAAVGLLRPAMLRFDRRAARTASIYIANSTVVADRIRAAYDIEPVVVHPPVMIDADGPQQEVATDSPDFFLTVGRGRGYKNTDRLIEAFRAMPEQHLVIVGTEADAVDLPPNVQVLGRVAEAELRWLYSNCRALMSVANEDFGLTPLEANAMGAPALVVRAGGFLDSLAEGVSGHYIESFEVADIVRAVQVFPKQWNRDDARRHAERFSLEAFVAQLEALIHVGGRDAEQWGRLLGVAPAA